MKFTLFSDPEYASLKWVVIIFVLVLVAFFALRFGGIRNNPFPGLVSLTQGVEANIDISPRDDARPVVAGVYGVSLQNYIDIFEPATDGEEYLEELGIKTVRNTGGLSKYIRWKKTPAMELTASEQAALIDNGEGLEVRGYGYTIADREYEESINGNQDALEAITTPRTWYGNLDYLEGWQNLYPHNYIHDLVDVATGIDATLLYTINMRSGTPAEARDQVTFLADSGVDVKVECGNEDYFSDAPWDGTGDNVDPDNAVSAVNAYLDTCDEFRTAILAATPGVEFAVSVAAPKYFNEQSDIPGNVEYQQLWNAEMKKQMNIRDYKNYIVHLYPTFEDCKSLIYAPSLDRDAIMSCGRDELRSLRSGTLAEGTFALKPTLEGFRAQYPAKNMWLTEWNMNQQNPWGTDGMYANSMIAAMFTQNFLTIINDVNAENDDFIKYAIYHAFTNSEEEGMMSKRNAGETGDTYIRRTPFYAMKTLKDIYMNGGSMATTTFSLSSGAEHLPINAKDVSMASYTFANGTIDLTLTNATGNSFALGTVTYDGKVLDLDKSKARISSLSGPSLAGSFGSTHYAANPGLEASYDDDKGKLSSVVVPAYSVMSLVLKPVYLADSFGTNGSFLEGLLHHDDADAPVNSLDGVSTGTKSTKGVEGTGSPDLPTKGGTTTGTTSTPPPSSQETPKGTGGTTGAPANGS